MARKKQKPEGSELIGRVVRQAAKEFGRAWAMQEYGDDWETAVVSGTVIAVRGNGCSVRKPVMIEWETGDEEPVSFAQVDALLEPSDLTGSGPQDIYFALFFRSRSH